MNDGADRAATRVLVKAWEGHPRELRRARRKAECWEKNVLRLQSSALWRFQEFVDPGGVSRELDGDDGSCRGESGGRRHRSWQGI